MKLSDSQKKEIVNRIRQSKTFSNARTSSLLLQYLFESTLKGNTLKEEVIDIEFYGNDNIKSSDNPRVRVNVYNLRKKLSSYYENEGKGDRWHLVIDKGQYQVSFVKNASVLKSLFNVKWTVLIPYAALFFIISFLIVSKYRSKPTEIWRPFVDSEKPVYVYVGDVFGTVGKNIMGGRGWTRNYGINSFSDFYDFIKQHPELKDSIAPSSFSMTTSMGVISIKRIQSYFQYYNSDFSIRFSTRTTTSEIKEGNAIYFGAFWNENKFINYFNHANEYYKIINKSLVLKGHPEKSDKVYDIFTPGDYQEYAVVSKYPATNGTNHLVFFSHNDIGVCATVEYFTNKDSLNNFEDNYLKGNEYFTAVFKVTGQERTNTSLELDDVITFN